MRLKRREGNTSPSRGTDEHREVKARVSNQRGEIRHHRGALTNTARLKPDGRYLAIGLLPMVTLCKACVFDQGEEIRHRRGAPTNIANSRKRVSNQGRGNAAIDLLAMATLQYAGSTARFRLGARRTCVVEHQTLLARRIRKRKYMYESKSKKWGQCEVCQGSTATGLPPTRAPSKKNSTKS